MRKLGSGITFGSGLGGMGWANKIFSCSPVLICVLSAVQGLDVLLWVQRIQACSWGGGWGQNTLRPQSGATAGQ